MSDVNLLVTVGDQAPVELVADPGLFEPGSLIRYGPAAEPHRVTQRRVLLDDAGKLRIEIGLTPYRRRLRWFDDFAQRHDFVVPVLTVAVLGLISAPIITLFVFFAKPRLEQLAWAGWAIALAPAVLGLGVWIGLSWFGLAKVEKFSSALGAVVATLAATAAFIVFVVWQELFVPVKPSVWPGDYAALAVHFAQSSAAIMAACSVGTPVILVVLKLIGLDVIGPVVSLVLGKKG